RRLAERGLSVIFISHKLREVLDLCSEVTVLRDGEVVLHADTANTTLNDLTTAMVGMRADEAKTATRRRPPQAGRPLLEVSNLRLPGRRESESSVSFRVHEKEIVGIIGLLGSGVEELGATLFGVAGQRGGVIAIKGATRRVAHPAD